MTATLVENGTTGSPDGPSRAGAPSVRETWEVGLLLAAAGIQYVRSPPGRVYIPRPS